jgi:hypothetical protein
MTGAVSWEQLIFIVADYRLYYYYSCRDIQPHIIASRGNAFSELMATYKSTIEEQSKLRNDLRAGIDDKITNVADKHYTKKADVLTQSKYSMPGCGC